MNSEKQILANRQNAQLSTGPVTQEGKEASRQNSFRHGIWSEDIVIEGEDPDRFDDLKRDLEAELGPVGFQEAEIVERMVAELEALAPLVADPDDRATLEAWFDDWHELYLADRWDHVERLESAGPDTPDESLAFLVQDLRYGRRIDGLANVNEMESCVLPGDI